MKRNKKCIAKYYGLYSGKLPVTDQPVRLVFISDLHDVAIGRDNRGLLKKIADLRPDLILIGGDIVVGKPGHTMKNMEALLEGLRGGAPVFAANGNHEYRLRIYPETYGDMYQRYRSVLGRCGVRLLENEKAQAVVRGARFVINGYELPREYYQRFYRGSLPERELSEVFPETERDDGAFQILLAHEPRYFETYCKWKPDLILSGHYHGGIIRMPDGSPLIGNNFSLFPKYACGRFRRGDTVMIASAGLGEHTIPVRINNPRELTVVDLRAVTDRECDRTRPLRRKDQWK